MRAESFILAHLWWQSLVLSSYGDSSEIKFTDEFFWNFPWKFSTKHCFEKKKW